MPMKQSYRPRSDPSLITLVNVLGSHASSHARQHFRLQIPRPLKRPLSIVDKRNYHNNNDRAILISRSNTQTLLVKAPSRRSADFVFGNFDASTSGWLPGGAFFVGLLESAYTLTGYGMVAAMCEEVNNPQHEVPRAMVLSVLAAGITGVLWLIPILFVLPDVKILLAVASGQPMPLLFKLVTGSAAGGFGLLFCILGVLFFAGVGALTAASRCTYAFARDGAIPFSNLSVGLCI
jgi:amino acid transporter